MVSSLEIEAWILDGDVFEIDENAFIGVEIHSAVAGDQGVVGAGLDLKGLGFCSLFRLSRGAGFQAAGVDESQGGGGGLVAVADVLGECGLRGCVELFGHRSNGNGLRLDRREFVIGNVRRRHRDQRGGREAQGDECGIGEWVGVHGSGRRGGDPGVGRAAEETFAVLESVDKSGSVGNEPVGGDLHEFLG